MEPVLDGLDELGRASGSLPVHGELVGRSLYDRLGRLRVAGRPGHREVELLGYPFGAGERDRVGAVPAPPLAGADVLARVHLQRGTGVTLVPWLAEGFRGKDK